MKKDFSIIVSIPVFLALVVFTMMAHTAIGQMYFQDDFSNLNSLDEKWDVAGATTQWAIENGELTARGAGYDWNLVIVKKELWKNWTDYTYEVKIIPETNRVASWIYQIFRYSQPFNLDRINFFSYHMDQSTENGLYIDRFLNSTRTRPVPDTVTFAGVWINDREHILMVEVTKTTITGYLDGEKQFGPLEEGSLANGRVGLGVWETDARFDDVKVYGPLGIAVEFGGKAATTWGQIRD